MASSAIAFLTKEHATARALLESLTKTTDRGIKTRKELLGKLAPALRHHMRLEEEIFYPAFKEAMERKKDTRLYYESKEEHHAIEKVLKDLCSADPGSEAFGGKAKVLKELVEHHTGEEEREMFPRAEQAFDKDELADLAERMMAREEQLENGRAWDTSASATPMQ